MGVASEVSRISYAGDGATKAFAVPFPFFADADLLVILRTIATGAEATQALVTNYSVTGAGTGSGTVTFSVAPANTVEVHIILAPARTQTLALVDGSAIPAAAAVGAWDKIVLQAQRAYDRALRSLRLRETDTPGTGVFQAEAQRITNLAAPTAASDAATKAYVDSLVLGAGAPAPPFSNADVAAGAGIELDKLDGYSDSEAERQSVLSPGTHGARTDATTMQEELRQLRYVAKRLLGINTHRDDGATKDTDPYSDLPALGPNLLRNGSFEGVYGAGSLPEGWTAVGAATLARVAAQAADGAGAALSVTATGADQGVSQTLAKLKANTRYLVAVRARVTAGDTARLRTTGANAGQWRNANEATTSVPSVWVAAIIETDAVVTSIVVQLLAAANTDVVFFDHACVRECGDGAAFSRDVVRSTVQLTGGFTTTIDNLNDAGVLGRFWTDAAGAWEREITIPGPGYYLEVELDLSMVQSAANVTADDATFRLYVDIDNSGAWTLLVADVSRKHTLGVGAVWLHDGRLLYRLENPLSGSRYKFRATASVTANTYQPQNLANTRSAMKVVAAPHSH